MMLDKSSWIKEDFKSKILIFLKLIRVFFWLIACHVIWMLEVEVVMLVLMLAPMAVEECNSDDLGDDSGRGETDSDNDSMIV